VTARVLPYGPRARLVETDEDPLALAAALEGVAGVVDVVPAARTVLVTFAPDTDVAAAVDALSTREVLADAGDQPPAVEIPVVYDGADLAAVAAACDMTMRDVIDRHAAATYRCAFCGFAPGFGYLRGLDPALHLPRLPTPRTRVPAGAVAIAAEFSAVYPSVSPGGWHLLGRTTATLWDVRREPPALIVPGAVVQFVETRP
jgi:KipI family sensor histidine kinase inhibitor